MRVFGRLFSAILIVVSSVAQAAAPAIPPSAPTIINYRALAQAARLNGAGRPLRILPVGDSITQGATGVSNNVYQYAGTYAETAIFSSGRRFQILGNAGVYGQTLQQIQARVPAVIAQKPDVVLLEGGTNNFTLNMANSVYATNMNVYEQMIQSFLVAGILPVVVVPPPKNSAPYEAKLSRFFYYQVAQFYGLPLLDLHQIWVDPAAVTGVSPASGGPFTGFYQTAYSTDGTHPTPAAIAVSAPILASVLANIETSICPPYLADASELASGSLPNLIRNGSFAQQATAGVPDSWTINSTNASYTATGSAQIPYSGKTFAYTKTASGAVYALYGAGITTGYATTAGEQFLFSGRINVSGLTPASATGLTVSIDGIGSTNARVFNGWLQNGNFDFASVVTPSSASAATLTPNVYVADAGTYTVNNLTLVDITKMNAIWQPGQQAY